MAENVPVPFSGPIVVSGSSGWVIMDARKPTLPSHRSIQAPEKVMGSISGYSSPTPGGTRGSPPGMAVSMSYHSVLP